MLSMPVLFPAFILFIIAFQIFSLVIGQLIRINPSFWSTTHPPLPRVGVWVNGRVNLNPMEGLECNSPETGIDPVLAERAMVRAMCGTNLMEKKRTEGLIDLMVKVNGVRWYGHVLRKDDGHVLRKALEVEVKGKRKLG